MKLADKIIELRRQLGWTQDDLAERLDVSRQSVSKWEGDQAYPSLDKIVEMSRLFGVSTDYLLKDEWMEAEQPDLPLSVPAPDRRTVTMAEAREFMDLKAQTARPMARGVMLCILSPIFLLLLIGAVGEGRLPLSEPWSVGLGLIVLFVFVVPAVAIFIACGIKTERFAYMEKEIFDTVPGVTQMVRERMEQDRPAYSQRLVTGICLCVASVVPIFAAMATEAPFLTMCAVSLTLALVSVGVRLIMLASIPWGSYKMLLQEGDYAPERKTSLLQSVTVAYWCIATAGYLGYSLYSGNWDTSWIIWPVAGVLYAGLAALLATLGRKKR